MKKFIKKLLVFILLLITIASAFIIYQGYNIYKTAISSVSLTDKIKNIKQNNNYVLLADLPSYYKNAVVSVEDHRFYNHGPIDLIAIARAIYTDISQKQLLEGGSTITQQVAKNLYFISGEENALYRKIAEIFVAYDLEKEYSKDEILEFYINTIYFGDGYYGIEEACNGYLDKASKFMTLYEATMMAGIPNAPSVYAPTVNLDLTLNRQKKVISTMVENEYLTQKEADALIAEQPQL